MKKNILKGAVLFTLISLNCFDSKGQIYLPGTAGITTNQSTGNVGIGVGTTVPRTKLTIAGQSTNINDRNVLLELANSPFNSTYKNEVSINFDNSAPSIPRGYFISAVVSGNEKIRIGGYNDANGKLSDREFLVIDGFSGNIGIGTQPTTNKLEVNGNAKLTGNLNLTGNVYGNQTAGNLGIFSNTQYNDGASILLYGNSGTVGSSLRYGDVEIWAGKGSGTNKWGNINLAVFNPNTLSGETILFANGLTKNVGLGTVSPTSRLHVIGDAIITDKLAIGTTFPSNPSCTSLEPLKLLVGGIVGAREFRCSLNQWCDYVFENDYKLKSLKEVEKYIQTNKHLPEVPSEKEVVENGMAMGEMMKIHMKKIEELTLYMIELQKQNEKLASEVADLKK